MTFKLTERDIRDICNALVGYYDAYGIGAEKEPLMRTMESIRAWLDTMPAEDRIIYLLGRKA